MFPAWSQHKLARFIQPETLLDLFFLAAVEQAHLALLFYTIRFNDIFRSPSHFVFLRVITHIKKKHSLVFRSTDLIMSLIKSWLTEGHRGGSGICHCLSAGVWLHLLLVFLCLNLFKNLLFPKCQRDRELVGRSKLCASDRHLLYESFSVRRNFAMVRLGRSLD